MGAYRIIIWNKDEQRTVHHYIEAVDENAALEWGDRLLGEPWVTVTAETVQDLRRATKNLSEVQIALDRINKIHYNEHVRAAASRELSQMADAVKDMEPEA